MRVETDTLPNGLRVIHRWFPSEISYCGLAINTGSRDEYREEFGMAHFVEHMLFKGTKKRRAHHIANRMESVGGELNAYTTKEETFIYSTFLKEYFSRAVELLSDLVLRSEFPSHQIERERDVVLDEIASYRDFPSEQIYDDFENLVFKDHEMGHYILGEPDTLAGFTTDSLKRFTRRQYQPSEMVFFSFGKISFSQVMRQVEKLLSFPAPEGIPVKEREKPGILLPRELEIPKNTNQAHVMLGWSTFDMHHPDKYTLYLINNILGGGSLNSRFSTSLREKNGLVYHVESSIAFYTDTGLFTVYFACDPKYKERCIRLIGKEIDKIKKKKLTPLQLSKAKRQWKGHVGIAAESNENSCLNMAKKYLHQNRDIPLSEVFSRIDQISSEKINEVANDIFSTSRFQLSYV